MKVEKFGRTADGTEIYRYRLGGPGEAHVDILNLGGIIQSLATPDRAGRLVDVALGFDTVAEYEADSNYIGALIGRWAGRIAGAAFELNGARYSLAANEGANHLHGGRQGFNRKIWEASEDNGALVLSRVSPDGEEGYPGTMTVKVRHSFDGRRLTMAYEAESDRDAVVNLTSHSYFNLNGAGYGDILNHRLILAASQIVEVDQALIPTGRLLPVAGAPFDFRTDKPIGRDMHQLEDQLGNGGYDHYFLSDFSGPDRPAAQVYAPESGIRLTVFTTAPGLQFYTGNYLNVSAGKNGRPYGPHSGFCLETQLQPKAPNRSFRPEAIVGKRRDYQQITTYDFSTA